MKLSLRQTECFHTTSTPRDSQFLFSKTQSICHNISTASSCPTTTSNKSFWVKISWKRYLFFFLFRNIRWNKVLNNSDFAEQVKRSLTTQWSLHMLPYYIWSVCPVCGRECLDHTDVSVFLLVPKITQSHEYILLQPSESVWKTLPVFWWRRHQHKCLSLKAISFCAELPNTE